MQLKRFKCNKQDVRRAVVTVAAIQVDRSVTLRRRLLEELSGGSICDSQWLEWCRGKRLSTPQDELGCQQRHWTVMIVP
jgi:hypothetical protein